jgi:hypothetical protein
LDLNQLCQDRREFQQLMALLNRLRLAGQIGATCRALRYPLWGDLIGHGDPGSGGAGMAELRAMLGFAARWALGRLLIAGGWLGRVVGGGGWRGDALLQLLDSLE